MYLNNKNNTNQYSRKSKKFKQSLNVLLKNKSIKSELLISHSQKLINVINTLFICNYNKPKYKTNYNNNKSRPKALKYYTKVLEIKKSNYI